MRNIRWQVRFKNRSEEDVRVDIYDEEWSGEISQLTPSEQPFETDETDEDDIMAPVRTQTGYIRVIDEGNLDGLVPDHASHHYVECRVGDAVRWCGYMKPDVYTSEWAQVKSEAEFPVVSGLGYLDGMYLSTQKDMGIVTFRSLLAECLDAAGVAWQHVYLPKEFSEAADAQVPYTYPLSMEISRYNFFGSVDADFADETEEIYESDTCLSVLEEFAKFFGWTLIERGRDLYFLSVADVDYICIRYAVLGSGAMGTTDCERTSMAIEGLEWRGDDHTSDMMQGVTKITVEVDMNPVEDAVIQVDSDKLTRETTITETYTTATRKGYYRVYGKGGSDAGVEFLQYDSGYDENNAYITYPVEFDAEKVLERFGAAFISYEIYDSSTEDRKKNYNFTDAVIVPGVERRGLSSYALGDKYSYEAVRLTNKSIARYANGAFVISANVTAMVDRFDMGTNNAGGYLEFRLRVGELYWSGEEWKNEVCSFKVGIGSNDSTEVDSGTGQILSTKTLEQPYNGADGYVIPITQAIGGEIELVVMVPHINNEGSSNGQWFLFNGLKLEYYQDDGDWTKNTTDRQKNYYKKVIDLFTDEKEVKLKIGSDKNNGACYASVMRGTEYLTEVYDEAAKCLIRPEYSLLNKLKAQYGVLKERLTLSVRAGMVTPLHRITYGGKTYMPTGEGVQYADDTEELTLIEL